MVKKILVVDDDPKDLVSMKKILENNKYQVVTVNDGAKAYDLVKKNGFDLILIDIKMPTLSGYDLLRLMREKVSHKVAMIYVSIVPESEVDMENVDGFVQKPFSSKSLLAEVKRVLEEI